MDDPGTEIGVREPRQERSRRTRDRIVGAALELIAERGVEGATVQEIVERAGSSVGSFYARFDGKEEFLRYLRQGVWAEASERWQEGIACGRWRGAGLAEVVEGLVELLMEVERADAAGRSALGESSGPAGGAAERFRERVRDDVRSLLLERRAEIGHPDPEGAVDMLLVVLAEVARPLATDPHGVEELARLSLAYLRAGEAADEGARATTVDFFDVWG